MSAPTNKLKKLGRYKIEGILGKGAMGVVYKGEDPLINRTVAIKTIHQHHLDSDPSHMVIDRFRREAQTAGQCQHPNIVTIYEFAEDKGIPFIAMEYIEGNELKKILQKPQILDINQKLKIIAQVLDALQYAHVLKIIHRDIKPANIFLMQNGTVKVTDFGIARINGSDITQTGFTVGSPNYMSPEQIRGEEIDNRTDLFSTGVVLYEALTGKKPFIGGNATATLHAVLYEEPTIPSKINPCIPKSLNNLVLKALEKDRALRFRDGNEFSDAINKACLSSVEEAGDDGTDVLAIPATVSLPLLKSRTKLESAIGTTSKEKKKTWRPSTLKKLANSLIQFVGPVAKKLVEKHSSDAATLEKLSKVLAEHIPNDEERYAFLNSLNFSPEEKIPMYLSVSDSVSDSFEKSGHSTITQQELEEVEQSLTFYIGPMAHILVKKNSDKAKSKSHLCKILSVHIPNKKEKAEFLDNMSD